MRRNRNFEELIARLSRGNVYRAALEDACNKYLVGCYKIWDIVPQNARVLYSALIKKVGATGTSTGAFNGASTAAKEGPWKENELRIFVWVLVGYAYLEGKDLACLEQADLKAIQLIFPHLDTLTIDYQGRSLVRNEGRCRKWQPEEAALIEAIIAATPHLKWNEVAKKLFFESAGLFCRSGKQCRERYFNHIDPSKKRNRWSREEDLSLLQQVIAHGRRWALVAKSMGNQRTEHTIKNRFKSLVQKEAKKGGRTGSIDEHYLLRALSGCGSYSQESMESQDAQDTPNDSKEQFATETSLGDACDEGQQSQDASSFFETGSFCELFSAETDKSILGTEAAYNNSQEVSFPDLQVDHIEEDSLFGWIPNEIVGFDNDQAFAFN